MIKSSCIIILFLLSGLFSGAQENVIKAGVTGLFIGDINFGYERMMSHNSSLNFKFGFLNPTISPFISESDITPDAYNLAEANGGITASLEYRFYLSKKTGLKGFYVAPYLRYLSQNMVFEDVIEDFEFFVKTKNHSLGFGGQLGYQWVIDEIFTIDFFFFGTGIDFHNAELKYILVNKPPEFNYSMVTKHVDDVFADISYLHKKLRHEINADNHTTRLPFLFPGVRIGISVGIAF
jgi:hypothetical protein